MASIKAAPIVEIKRKKTPAKLPTKIGALLDVRWVLKLQKDELVKAMDTLEKEITLVEDAIFLRYGKEGDLEGARGKLCQASISEQVVPIAEDWDKIYQFIRKGKGSSRFSLIQKRLGVTAVRELEDNGVAIPGVGSMKKKRLSLTKVK